MQYKIKILRRSDVGGRLIGLGVEGLDARTYSELCDVVWHAMGVGKLGKLDHRDGSYRITTEEMMTFCDNFAARVAADNADRGWLY